jgi:hypothetical protein
MRTQNEINDQSLGTPGCVNGHPAVTSEWAWVVSIPALRPTRFLPRERLADWNPGTIC